MPNKTYYLQVTTDQIAAIEAAGLKELAASMRESVAEIESEDSNACRSNAKDNEGFTPEWSGPVSFCEDGKAWVMTWELVDNPCDTSDVFNIAMLDAEHASKFDPNLPWIFETEEDQNAFATEEEACAAQRDHRRMNGFDEVTGQRA